MPLLLSSSECHSNPPIYNVLIQKLATTAAFAEETTLCMQQSQMMRSHFPDPKAD